MGTDRDSERQRQREMEREETVMEAERDRSRDTEKQTELGECLFCPCLWSPIQGFKERLIARLQGSA